MGQYFLKARKHQVRIFLPYLERSRDLQETVPLTIFCLVSELAASLHVGHSRCRWSSSHPSCVQNGNWKQHGLEHLSISLLKRGKAWGITKSISSRITGLTHFLNFKLEERKRPRCWKIRTYTSFILRALHPGPETLWPTCPIHGFHSTRRKKSLEGHLRVTINNNPIDHLGIFPFSSCPNQKQGT